MFDVLMLVKNDWANTGWRFFKCLQYLGLDVLALKGEFHPFYYPEQIPIHPVLAKLPNNSLILEAFELHGLAQRAKVLHFITSTLIHPGVNLQEKKIVMQHGGGAYRANHEMLNPNYNKVVNTTIIQMPDLLGHGANNEQWVYYPVDTEFLKPDFKKHGKKLKIGHFPSLPEHKGTAKIIKIMKSLEEKYGDRFEYVGVKDDKPSGRMMWRDSLNRVRDCDIIIEAMEMKAQGKIYGEWGNAALEAAALGKIVITHSLAQDLYKKEFGSCSLNIANDPETLKETLINILSLSDKEILSMKQQTRAWVEEKHSIPVTAKRLWEKVYKDLL